MPQNFFGCDHQIFLRFGLAQFAMLYYERDQFIFTSNSWQDALRIFMNFSMFAEAIIGIQHYNFGISSLERKKRITKSFVDLLVINTIIPLKFCYASATGTGMFPRKYLKLASEISSEENTIVKKFNSLKHISKNAYQSQALLQLKNEYCDKNRCLHCAVGNSIIGSENENNKDQYNSKLIFIYLVSYNLNLKSVICRYVASYIFITPLFEKRGFYVSSRLADRLGMRAKSVRLFFIYVSFATFGVGFAIYLTTGFFVKAERSCKYKTNLCF